MGTREKSGRRPPLTGMDPRHGKLGKTTYQAHTHTPTQTLTQTRERAKRVHVKKMPDARRGREWTRAMENW